MVALPATMRGLVAPKHCGPDGYQLADLPVPVITKPDQILIRIHAGAIMAGDCQRAHGSPLLRKKFEMPMHIGTEGAGTVVAVGSAVTRFKPGDAVYGLNVVRPMFTEPDSGYCNEYATGTEHVFLHKPDILSWEEAAGFVSSAVSAYQTIKAGLAFAGVDSLEGQTVYVPAALSGLGHMAIQIAKNVFGAKRIISTVSTPKMDLVEQWMPGMVDQLIDYTKENIEDVVPRGSVDFMVNTQWNTLNAGFRLLKPDTGILVSLTSIPTSKTLKGTLGEDNVPLWMAWVLDLAQYWYSWKMRGTNIKYAMISGNPEVKEDLYKIGELAALGKLKAVYRTVKLSNIDEVRAECAKVDTGKGGIGRLVVLVKE